ncbi:MAG: putative nuclease of restriction endonuclease-like (RecB) superfamily [Crocinitomix sp.]|jgi:predicted nuclease of restriction endonuclease-like (RecB) superfamily
MSNQPLNTNLIGAVVELLQLARKRVVHAVNHIMVITYYEIGRKIVEEEQKGKERAGYGKHLMEELSNALTTEFGKGFSRRNLEQMRQFYVVYSIPQTLSAESENQKPQTVSAVLGNQQIPSIDGENQKQQTLSAEFKLSWSHYLKLMRIDDENARKFYEIEAFKNNWSVRELDRQYDSGLYTRLTLSRDKEEVKKLSEQGLIIEKAKDLIKDPYILEFIGLPEQNTYSENELETALINKLEHFLLELGSGFTFVARQKRISFDDKHFRIDLVFYNRLLKCFFLIDLKIGELKHQDIGQMQMYVNYYDREVKLDDENKTIGLILSQNKSEAVVKYTLPENNEQIFASKYKTVLPSKEELKALLGD